MSSTAAKRFGVTALPLGSALVLLAVARPVAGQSANGEPRSLVGSGRARLRIENDPHAEVPRERAQLLQDATCREVIEEFHAKHENTCLFPVTLILGNSNKHCEEDQPANTYTIFLDRWSEDKFTLGIMRFSVLRLANHRERNRIRARVVSRIGALGTVSVTQLRKTK